MGISRLEIFRIFRSLLTLLIRAKERTQRRHLALLCVLHVYNNTPVLENCKYRLFAELSDNLINQRFNIYCQKLFSVHSGMGSNSCRSSSVISRISYTYFIIIHQRQVGIDISTIPNGNRISHCKRERRFYPYSLPAGSKQFL